MGRSQGIPLWISERGERGGDWDQTVLAVKPRVAKLGPLLARMGLRSEQGRVAQDMVGGTLISFAALTPKPGLEVTPLGCERSRDGVGVEEEASRSQKGDEGWWGWGQGLHLALGLQVRLVPNQHDGKVVAVLHSQDLCEQLAHLVEAAQEVAQVSGSALVPPSPPTPSLSLTPSPLPVIDGKHQQEAVASAQVLLSHSPKLLLACRVQDCRDRKRGRREDKPQPLYPPPPAQANPPLPGPSLSSRAGMPSTVQILV